MTSMSPINLKSTLPLGIRITDCHSASLEIWLSQNSTWTRYTIFSQWVASGFYSSHAFVRQSRRCCSHITQGPPDWLDMIHFTSLLISDSPRTNFSTKKGYTTHQDIFSCGEHVLVQVYPLLSDQLDVNPIGQRGAFIHGIVPPLHLHL